MNINKKVINILMAVFILIALPFYSFADGNQGEGGGSNQDEPLLLVRSSIESGDQNVPVSICIELEFNKNVVNMSVEENNRSSIGLVDSKGQNVPINIEMGDDQIDPTIKRNIKIYPIDNLEYGKQYILKISEKMSAKSGAVLGEDIKISFGTESDMEPNNEAKEKTELEGNDLEQPELVSAGTTINSSDESLENSGNSNQKANVKKITVRFISYGLLGASLLLFLIYLKRRIK